MTYDPTVPAASQRISDTQTPIQNNFTVLNDVFNEDHFNYDDASGDPPPPGLRGFHRMSTYSDLGGDPTAFPEIGTVYTKDNGDGRIDLFYRYDDDTLGNSKILPLSAIKVMCAFRTTTADGLIAASEIYQAYNISSITKSTSGGNYFFDVRFADSLDSNPANSDLEYIVLTGHGTASDLTNLIDGYQAPTKNDRILFIARNNNISRMSFSILTL